MATVINLFDLISPEILQGWAQKTLSHQFTQMTLAFLAASWLHSGRVKKEIRSAFVGLTDAIDNVANKVTNELAGIKSEIKHLDDRMGVVENKIKGEK